MGRPNTATGAEIITAKQVMNLKKYGFLNVTITQDPSSDGKILCSHGKDGKPDHEYLQCNQQQAADIAAHLRKIGWSR